MEQISSNLKYQELLEKLNFFKSIEQVEQIITGYSGALTTKVKEGDKFYFVKFLNKTKNFDKNFQIFSKQCQTPKLFKKGEIDNFQYFITEFINGFTIKSKYDVLSNNEVYKIGQTIGNEQLKISTSINSIPAKEYFTKFTKKWKDQISNVGNLLNINKDMISIESYGFLHNLFNTVNKRFKKFIKFFNNEPAFYCHSDLKIGNFILTDDKVYTVDFENTDYEFMAYKIRSDFYDIIERSPIRYKTWFFIKGFIDSFYNYKIPKNLKTQLEFVFYYSLSGRITKRLNEKNYADVERIFNNLTYNFREFKKISNLFDFEAKKDKFMKTIIKKEK